MKNEQKIYRVVIVHNGDITWADSKFFSTEHSAIREIEERASEWDDTYTVEKYPFHPWASFQMNEGVGKQTFLVVHMITNVIDEKLHIKSTYGVVEYELK